MNKTAQDKCLWGRQQNIHLTKKKLYEKNINCN